ncbi:collagen alpha-1(I) chain-like [Dipodomys spectabilis]|uniref:collagen alpha-1(I) chain-like n=1 Tax=Dipodomys spectabilis TaxID=105255 RepID=UPI001C542F43|nr:collagen alpha-1(I) chain-like [Dipodomys spectabilis]
MLHLPGAAGETGRWCALGGLERPRDPTSAGGGGDTGAGEGGTRGGGENPPGPATARPAPERPRRPSPSLRHGGFRASPRLAHALDSLVRVSRRVGWVADVAADPQPDSGKTRARRAGGRYRPHTVHGLGLDQKDLGPPRAAPGSGSSPGLREKRPARERARAAPTRDGGGVWERPGTGLPTGPPPRPLGRTGDPRRVFKPPRRNAIPGTWTREGGRARGGVRCHRGEPAPDRATEAAGGEGGAEGKAKADQEGGGRRPHTVRGRAPPDRHARRPVRESQRGRGPPRGRAGEARQGPEARRPAAAQNGRGARGRGERSAETEEAGRRGKADAAAAPSGWGMRRATRARTRAGSAEQGQGEAAGGRHDPPATCLNPGNRLAHPAARAPRGRHRTRPHPPGRRRPRDPSRPPYRSFLSSLAPPRQLNPSAAAGNTGTGEGPHRHGRPGSGRVPPPRPAPTCESGPHGDGRRRRRGKDGDDDEEEPRGTAAPETPADRGRPPSRRAHSQVRPSSQHSARAVGRPRRGRSEGLTKPSNRSRPEFTRSHGRGGRAHSDPRRRGPAVPAGGRGSAATTRRRQVTGQRRRPEAAAGTPGGGRHQTQRTRARSHADTAGTERTGPGTGTGVAPGTRRRHAERAQHPGSGTGAGTKPHGSRRRRRCDAGKPTHGEAGGRRGNPGQHRAGTRGGAQREEARRDAGFGPLGRPTPERGTHAGISPPPPPWRTGGPAGRNPRREQNRSGKTLQKPPPPRRRASPTPGEQPHELSAVPPPQENTNTTPDSTVRRWPATRPNRRGSRKADAGEEGTPEAQQEEQREGHRVGSPGREASERAATPSHGRVAQPQTNGEVGPFRAQPARQVNERGISPPPTPGRSRATPGTPSRPTSGPETPTAAAAGPPKRGPRGKRQLSHTPQRPRERPRSRPRQQGPTASIHTTPPGTAPIIDRLFFGRVSKGPHTPGSSAPGGQNPPERRTTTGTAAPEHRGAQRPHGAVVANGRRPTQTLGNSVARGRRGRGTGPPKTPRQPKHEAGKPHTTRPRIATRHGLQAPPLDTPHARQGRGRIGNVLHSPHQTTARERDVNLNGNFSLAQKPHEPEDGRDTPRAAGWHKAADNARIGNDTTTQPQAPERTNRERSGSTARGQSARRGFSHHTARASTEHRPSLSAERADPRANNESREERSKIRAPPSSSVYKSPTSRRGQGERSRARLPHPRLPAHHRRRHGGTGEGRGPRAEREERSHSP